MVSIKDCVLYVPLVAASTAGFAGAVGGLIWREANGIEHTFKITKDVVENACKDFTFLKAINDPMQELAKDQIGYKYCFSGLCLTLKNSGPAVLCLSILGLSYFAAKIDKKTKWMGILAGALPMAMGILADRNIQPLWADALGSVGFSLEASGHIAMMSAVGLALGLADRCASNTKSWSLVRVITASIALAYSIGTAVLVFNTAACRHTVVEVLDGISWFGTVGIILSGIAVVASR